MQAGEVAECQGRSERDAGPRIVSVHDRTHIVAAGIEPRDHSTVFSQNPGVAIRPEANSGAEIGRMDAKRVEWRLLDRRDARVRRMAGIAEMALVDV